LKIIYSFNKKGFEAAYWQREISSASNKKFSFIPFNHGQYLNPELYIRAQLLDNIYYEKNPKLFHLYKDFEALLEEHRADAVVVDNCPPYHPDYLKKLDFYKVLRIADGPLSAYDRDFAYLHAYHHILYHTPAYSSDMEIAEKLNYCGATNIDLWKLAAFDALHDTTKTEETVLAGERDIDIVFIGGLHLGKMPFLAKMKRTFGQRVRIHGIGSLKKKLYFSLKYKYPGWISSIRFQQYVPLYQRAKIGFNVHNRGKYTVGGYRLFDLPANGVMQISDGDEYLKTFFEVGEEVVGYRDIDDLIDKVHYYLMHDEERRRIAINGYRRVMQEHRFSLRMQQLGELIEHGMARIGWQC